MMVRNQRADCCDHREKKRRLKKLQRKMKRMEEKRNVNGQLSNDCEEDDEEMEHQRRKCEDTKAERHSKPPKYISIMDAMLRRIKPSMEDREKYSDDRHARCFLETGEIKKACSSAQDSKARKKGKTTQDSQPLNVNSDREADEEWEDDAGRRAENEKNGGSKDEEQKKRKRRPEKDSKGELSRPELNRKKKSMPELQGSGLTESDCEDSICSFDSEINLSGLSLTKEENEKIEKMRRSRDHSLSGKSKRTESK